MDSIEKPDLKAIEEYVNRLNEMIAADVEETSKRRRRINEMEDWDLAQLKIQYEEALHICRTYDMRVHRLKLEQMLLPFSSKA